MSNISPTQASLPPSPISEPTLRLHFIDGLRALAIFLVLGCHYLYHAHAACPIHVGPWRGDLFAPFQYGAVGVDLFLVLSGFCLYYPLVTLKNGKARPEPTLGEFARRRARRILPPYYASLILFSLWQYGKSRLHLHVSDIAAPPTFGNLAAHFAMLHTLRPDWLYGVNPVYWSLGLEWFLYIGFPIIVVGFRKFGLWPPALAVFALALAFQALIVGLLPSDREFFSTFLFARWPEFVLGMVAARLVSQGSLSRKRRSGIALTALALVLIAGTVETQNLSALQPLHSLLWGVDFFVLLLAASIPAGALHRLFSTQPLVWLGVISYSVYLTHFPLMHLLAAVAKHHLQSGPSYVLAWVFLFLPVTIGLGYLFHLVFEKPFMNAPKAKPTVHLAPVPKTGPAAVLAPTRE